jgi:RNA polymerase sigma-32 factor
MEKSSNNNSSDERVQETGKSLAKRDPLQAYLADIRMHPLLSPEEEYALAVRYFQSQEVEAAQKLVLGNLRLVVKIAFGFVRYYQNVLDLIQEGNIGLMQAVKKYDPFKGAKLSTYAAWWIRAYILKFIMNNYRIYKIGTNEAQKKLFYKLKQVYDRLAIEEETPSPKLLAQHFDVRESDVIEMQQILGEEDISLDAPIQEDSKTPFMNFFSSRDMPVDEKLADRELMDLFTKKLEEFSETLDDKEHRILKKRLLSDEPATLKRIGDEFGISRERIRQIEKRLVRKLKEYLSQFDEFSGIQIGHDPEKNR